MLVHLKFENGKFIFLSIIYPHLFFEQVAWRSILASLEPLELAEPVQAHAMTEGLDRSWVLLRDCLSCYLRVSG